MRRGAERVVLIVKIALALWSVCNPLLSSTSYCPLSTGPALVMARLAAVAPAIGEPLKNHWYFGRGRPATPTKNVATVPAHTSRFAGWLEMFSGTGPKATPGEPMSLAIAAWQVPPSPSRLYSPNIHELVS